MDKPHKCLLCVELYKEERLTCCSVQDLGLKEYAGVLVGDAGEEQTLGLHRTTRDDNLRSTQHAFRMMEEEHRFLNSSCY